MHDGRLANKSAYPGILLTFPAGLFNLIRFIPMKNVDSRRNFLLLNVAIASTALLSRIPVARAVDNPVQESDPTAQSMGYRADAAKVDKAKYPSFAAGQNCANCALYQGQTGAPSGGCPIFAGKSVASTGWCSAYSKKG
jgi:hypothetical protein